MPDRTIPFYNMILRCDDYAPRVPCLPQGFSLVPFHEGHEQDWARMEYALGDFDSLGEAREYFERTYMEKPGLLRERALFLVNREGRAVGSCMAWQDDRQGERVSSLHWLVVDREYRKKGLGRALCQGVMNIFAMQQALPVYIHTQPWSWKAVLLYLSMGFVLQKRDTFSHYENQYVQAMEALAPILTHEQLLFMKERSRA